jgi:hypothetical protein
LRMSSVSFVSAPGKNWSRALKEDLWWFAPSFAEWFWVFS